MVIFSTYIYLNLIYMLALIQVHPELHGGGWVDTQHLWIEEYDILRNLPGGDKGIFFKKGEQKVDMIIDNLGF